MSAPIVIDDGRHVPSVLRLLKYHHKTRGEDYIGSALWKDTEIAIARAEQNPQPDSEGVA